MENAIDFVKSNGADKLIVVVKNDDGVGAAWVNIDTYSFGGMMMEAAQRLADKPRTETETEGDDGK